MLPHLLLYINFVQQSWIILTVSFINDFESFIDTEGEMYMYNRNQNSNQNMSEFIRGKITEEEGGHDEEGEEDEGATNGSEGGGTKPPQLMTTKSNDDSLTNEIKSLDVLDVSQQQQQQAGNAGIKFKLDDDFLFQMDKGVCATRY